MERRQGSLVPIGKASGSLDGPVKMIHDTSPKARHHFTQADQVNQLVGASESDPDLGFMARLMTLCCLPRTNPGNRFRYVRRNGPPTKLMARTSSLCRPPGITSSPSEIFPGSCWPGSAPKRYAPETAR